MRIAYLSADHGIPVTGDKGAAVHIREVTRAMRDLGHEVELFVARLGERHERIAVPMVKLRPEIPARAGVVDTAEDSRILKERRNLAIADAAVEAIARRHREEPFDLVYERYSLFSDASARLRQRLSLRCVLEVNAPLLDEQRQYRNLVLEKEAREVMRSVFSSVDRLVAVSQEVGNHAIANGAPAEAVQVIANGIDPTKFRPEGPVLPITSEKRGPVIGFAGSFRPWHGLEWLLPAFREAAKWHPRAHLLLVGAGPLEEWIKGFVAGAGLDDRVTFTGWLDNEAMPAAIRAMDIATAPYPPMEHFYFSPLKIYEYLACGVPVVARRLGQIAETIEDGVNGRLIEPQADAGDLARAILELLDPAVRLPMAKRAGQGRESWSWHGKIKALLADMAPPAESGRRGFGSP